MMVAVLIMMSAADVVVIIMVVPAAACMLIFIMMIPAAACMLIFVVMLFTAVMIRLVIAHGEQIRLRAFHNGQEFPASQFLRRSLRSRTASPIFSGSAFSVSVRLRITVPQAST